MSEDKRPTGFSDEDLERFLVLLDQRELSPITVKALIRQFKEQREKLRESDLVIKELAEALERMQPCTTFCSGITRSKGKLLAKHSAAIKRAKGGCVNENIR